MPSHPRVEEVEDSDVDMSDPSEGDINDFDEADILRTRQPQQQQLSRQAPPPTAAAPTHQHQHQPPIQQPRGYPEMMPATDDSAYRAYQCLYPVYFDARRSRAEGRRVPKSLAVLNPLATEIVNACAALRLPTVLEAGRLHPKDWANPGRVKVALKEQHAAQPAVMKARVKNKHHLYVLVAQHLRAHPTTDGSAALRVVVRGAPPPPHDDGSGDGKWPRPAVPRGWKMSDLLPYYSPAMTGGGVSENFLKDMMKEMGGAGGPGGADMASLLAAAAGGGGGASGSGGTNSSKKEKKGKGK
ncbi:signal recognition particle, SRP19 subunit [Lasiosphaeria miniovina]|uniref:Signal recognition particle, SRP19 subunit n=1 Tax=Lasiosphaeria miniovina TaxID=1954250 RepID=A0AA40DMX2_9PEZI|nr:signal recognition particle, SRP19 subunit [Lasiosphaeria miniovina]KAK0706717.1 signal recognition particle, SRP19 subunit [Lasiosphaeria miniovina]